ncbi:general secretion pathway protein H [Marinobacter gudaonensis]|uniref:Type II secretion system protein H n=1 Tax=Marinobacter gudaonensis TaxID=375760 RepID=A0A1I6HZT7_9GAMM|nr:general secretion pathway protein H [Marinobacter gudaonensis]
MFFKRKGASTKGIAGFTLIELVVALLLVTLIVGLISPLIINSIQRAEINSVGRDLLAAIRDTRAQALITNKEQRILFDPKQNSYSALTNHRTVSLPSSLNLKLVTAQSELGGQGTASIRFFPNGSSTGGRVVLEGPGKTWVIDVAWLTGQIVLRRGLNDRE